MLSEVVSQGMFPLAVSGITCYILKRLDECVRVEKGDELSGRGAAKTLEELSMMIKINMFGLVCLLWSAGVLVSRADPAHYVSLAGSNDVGNNYNTWAGAATQIQWAVNVATNTEYVCVSNGTYYLTNQIVITNAITLYSLKGRDTTIINGNFPAYSNRCLWVSNINALVAGFTITNGYRDSTNDGYGGGVFLAGGCISNCIITGNTVTNYLVRYGGGGGVYRAVSEIVTPKRKGITLHG